MTVTASVECTDIPRQSKHRSAPYPLTVETQKLNLQNVKSMHIRKPELAELTNTSPSKFTHTPFTPVSSSSDKSFLDTLMSSPRSPHITVNIEQDSSPFAHSRFRLLPDFNSAYEKSRFFRFVLPVAALILVLTGISVYVTSWILHPAYIPV